jgi:hypothetical protein
MKTKWLAPSLLALCVVSVGTVKAAAHSAPPASAAAMYQDHDRWDEAPGGYHDAQRRGFHEGVEAARKDFADRRHANADDHEMYKHPPVDGHDRHEFRDGFREGYHRAMEHMRHDHDEMPHN